MHVGTTAGIERNNLLEGAKRALNNLEVYIISPACRSLCFFCVIPMIVCVALPLD